MTKFADALNKQHRSEMAALSGAAATDDLKYHHNNGRIYALEQKMLKVEARLAKVEAKLDRWCAAAAAPGALPPAPPADTDPAA